MNSYSQQTIPSLLFDALYSSSDINNEFKEQKSILEEKTFKYPKFLDSLIKDFTVNKDEEYQIYANFHENFQKAYLENTQNRISMIPIFQIPQNFKLCKDHPEILAVDIGGSTIRIAKVSLQANSSELPYRLSNYKQWLFHESEKVVDFKFFHDLALKINEVLEDKNGLNCGVVWSFPVDKDNKIITMGKGFTINDEVKDISLNKLIQQAVLDVSGKSIIVNSVINDSIAVNLSTLSSQNSICELSLILGTGLNSCIVVKDILYNVELGFYGRLLTATKYDMMIDHRFTDNQPINNWKEQPVMPLFMPLEFLCGSRYLCELVRLILEEEMNLEIVKGGNYTLSGEFLVMFDETDLDIINKNLRQRFDLKFTTGELVIIKKVVEIVLIRCSKYLKNGLLALKDLINLENTKQNENENENNNTVNIGFVGSFLQHSKYLQNLIKKDTILELQFIENSNLIGAVIGSLIESQRK